MSSNRPTSSDVAKRAGVSQSTVSYVMSGRRPISAPVRERVLATIEELGFEPHRGARALREARTSMIGLCIEIDSDSTMNETALYMGATIKRAQDKDYDVVIAPTGSAGIERLVRRRVCDGLIITGIQPSDDRVHRALKLKVPVVGMGRVTDGAAVTTVDIDTYRVGALMCERVAGSPHDRLVVVTNEDTDLASAVFIADFYRAITETAERLGVELEWMRLEGQHLPGYVERMREVTAKPGRCAFLVRDPKSTFTLVEAAGLLGMRPGVDLSILAHCSDDAAAAMPVPISNVSARPKKISQTAVDLLCERIDNPNAAPTATLIRPGKLAERGSILG